MTPPRSPARRAIDAVLADGAPHTRDELLEAAARAVPPGKAYRKGEHRRRAATAGGPRQRGDHDTATAAGARRVALEALHQATRRGAIARLADGTYRAVPE